MSSGKSDKSAPVPPPTPIAYAFDAHTHVDAVAGGDSAQINPVLLRAQEAGVTELVTVAEDVSSAQFAAQLARENPGVYGAVAIHPTRAQELTESAQQVISQLATHKEVVSIGETGLDWYWLDRDPATASREQQEHSFIWHIQLAKQVGKAVMIHNREADADVLSILDSITPPEQVIFHCFSGSMATAKACLTAGYTLSFSGTVTFKNSQELQEIARITPFEQMLVETDAPFLAPHPHRGKKNEPYCLPYTIEFLANLKGVPAEELAVRTRATAHRVYGITSE